MKLISLTRGERFKDARTVYNQHGPQTMAQVHKATGISASLIQELEDDSDRDFGYCKITKLAEHYGVSVDWLVGLAPARTVDPEIQGICKYTGLSSGTVMQLHDIQSFYGIHAANLIDTVMLEGHLDINDPSMYTLLSDLLCFGSGVDDSINGVLIEVGNAKKHYALSREYLQRDNRYNQQQKKEIEDAKKTLSAYNISTLLSDTAYEYDIEKAVAAFRQIVIGIVKQG